MSKFLGYFRFVENIEPNLEWISDFEHLKHILNIVIYYDIRYAEIDYAENIFLE